MSRSTRRSDPTLSVAAAADGATYRPGAPPYPSVGNVERSRRLTSTGAQSRGVRRGTARLFPSLYSFVCTSLFFLLLAGWEEGDWGTLLGSAIRDKDIPVKPRRCLGSGSEPYKMTPTPAVTRPTKTHIDDGHRSSLASAHDSPSQVATDSEAPEAAVELLAAQHPEKTAQRHKRAKQYSPEEGDLICQRATGEPAVPRTKRQEIMREAHDSAIGEHFEAQRTNGSGPVEIL